MTREACHHAEAVPAAHAVYACVDNIYLKYWTVTHKGDVRCRLLADQHYTRQSPGHPMWTRPGYNYVLYFADAHGEAAWCWWRPKWETGQIGTQRKDGLRCLECTLFRNVRKDRDAVVSSDLIRDAVLALQLPAAERELHIARPQALLLISGVSTSKTSARRSVRSLAGKCYRDAGWVDLPHRAGKADVWLQYSSEATSASPKNIPRIAGGTQ